jgi:hypothetical protein
MKKLPLVASLLGVSAVFLLQLYSTPYVRYGKVFEAETYSKHAESQPSVDDRDRPGSLREGRMNCSLAETTIERMRLAVMSQYSSQQGRRIQPLK